MILILFSLLVIIDTLVIICALHFKCFPDSALCCQTVIQWYLLDCKHVLMAFPPYLNTPVPC